MLEVGETVCDREFPGVALGVIVMVGESAKLETNVLDPDKIIVTLGVSEALPGIERGVTSEEDEVIVAEKVGVTVLLDVVESLSLPEDVAVGVGSELGVTLALAPNEMVAVGVE